MGRKKSLKASKASSVSPQAAKFFDIFLQKKRKPEPEPELTVDLENEDEEIVEMPVKKSKVEEIEPVDEGRCSPACEPAVSWTEKYKPKRGVDMIGNASAVGQMKSWVRDWQKCRKAAQFCSRRGADSDNESDPNTVLVICGEPGIGKTSLVYAVAEEMGMKVFEMNCSSKRSGKVVTETLHEATQSHHVGRISDEKPIAAAPSIMDFFSKKAARGKSSKTVPNGDVEEVPKNAAINSLAFASGSLILFDDVDVIFEEDELFWRSVRSLINETKKPVIFTLTQSLDEVLCNLDHFQIINMQVPERKDVVDHLKSICEKEKVDVARLDLDQFVEERSCDVRRCIQQLQFETDFTRVGDDEIPSQRVSRVCISQDEGTIIDNFQDSDETILVDYHEFLKSFAADSDVQMLEDILKTKFSIDDEKEQRHRAVTCQPVPFEDDDFVRQAGCAIHSTLSAFNTSDASRTLEVKTRTCIERIEKQLLDGNGIHSRHAEIALDYCPSLSSICADEMARSIMHSENSRRSRRFLHYLDNAQFFLDDDAKHQLLTLREMGMTYLMTL